MDLVNLPSDIIRHIFLQLKINFNYFLLNKRLNAILSSNDYWNLRLSLDFPYITIIKGIFRLIYELNYYKSLLSSDKNKNLGLRYKIHILHFLLNVNKPYLIFPCRNSYHRMLVHKFCQSKNLRHEKIQTSYKHGLRCFKCNSFDVLRTIDPDDDYYVYFCRSCGLSLSNEWAIPDKKPHYGIIISK